MLRSLNSLDGFIVSAIDGEIGKVAEFYFDDTMWTVRYMIVKTGGWLTGRKVLIAPEALLHPDWKNRSLPVNLTMQQVKDSPDIDTDKPVSRQEEDALYAYYPWQNYYDAGLFGENIGMMGMFPIPPAPPDEIPEPDASAIGRQQGDSHLRSTHRVKGYRIHAKDGEIGKVSDFIFDEDKWAIHFLVITTGSFFSHKKVLMSPAWIQEVKWAMNEVIINVTMGAIENSPVYDESKPLDDDYSTDLHNHYGKSSE